MKISPMFGMRNTSLTRYKTDVSEWIVSTHLTRQFHTERISHVLIKKKKRANPQKNMSKQKPVLDKRKQQLVTCIQLATEHIRDQKTDTNPNKRNVYSIKSAYQIEYDRREARSRDFQSNSREIYNETWGGQTRCILERERWGFGERSAM